MTGLTVPQSLAEWQARGQEYLPGHLGMECLAVEPDEVRLRMRVERSKCAWNGFLHAGAVVSLADTACGYATLRNLPEGASGFTTIELKSNFLGTTLEGDVTCVPGPSTRAARPRCGTPRSARTRPAGRWRSSAAPR